MNDATTLAPGTPAAEASRRRTFAIISHPDAGKTTLTEHLLLLGGAIRAAGQVKARGEARRARSDCAPPPGRPPAGRPPGPFAGFTAAFR